MVGGGRGSDRGRRWGVLVPAVTVALTVGAAGACTAPWVPGPPGTASVESSGEGPGPDLMVVPDELATAHPTLAAVLGDTLDDCPETPVVPDPVVGGEVDPSSFRCWVAASAAAAGTWTARWEDEIDVVAAVTFRDGRTDVDERRSYPSAGGSVEAGQWRVVGDAAYLPEAAGMLPGSPDLWVELPVYDTTSDNRYLARRSLETRYHGSLPALAAGILDDRPVEVVDVGPGGTTFRAVVAWESMGLVQGMPLQDGAQLGEALTLWRVGADGLVDSVDREEYPGTGITFAEWGSTPPVEAPPPRNRLTYAQAVDRMVLDGQ